MAQLPPKVPTMTTANWSNFPHQRMSSMANMMPITNNTSSNHQQQQHSWIDEFLDFSSAKRGAHRRSASDSIAFLETPLIIEECPTNNSTTTLRSSAADHHHHHNNEFDRLDDEQLMSMFSDDISGTVPQTVSSSNPSTPSDHNSINDEKPTPSSDQQIKNESGEVQSSCNNNNNQDLQPIPPPNSNDSIVDPKRVKRILANRQSAQRSRVRKLQYISELERSVTSLQTEVSALSPRVAFLDHQRLVLNVDNSTLKQRIAALAQDKIFKD
ncbi:Basic-leucine zipper transcription factor family protein, partial [Thalictrum thalictroides]